MSELEELYVDYLSYLIFMAKQLSWGYSGFALVKALEKALELQTHSTEIKDTTLYSQLREELTKTQGWASSEKEKWQNFLEKAGQILVESQ